jgi:hypothetical protein
MKIRFVILNLFQNQQSTDFLMILEAETSSA